MCLFVNSCKLAKIISYIEIQINFIIYQVIFGFKLYPTNFQFTWEIIGNFCLVDVSGFQITFYMGHHAFCFMLAHDIKGSSYWWLWNRGWAFFPVTYDDSFFLCYKVLSGKKKKLSQVKVHMRDSQILWYTYVENENCIYWHSFTLD